MRQVRMPRRRASDGMIGVNMEQLFDTRLLDIGKIVEKKKFQLANNPGRDFPIKRERLYSSMIWDKYTFNDGDDVEFGKQLNIEEDGNTIQTEKQKRIFEYNQKKKLGDLDKNDKNLGRMRASSLCDILDVCKNWKKLTSSI